MLYVRTCHINMMSVYGRQTYPVAGIACKGKLRAEGPLKNKQTNNNKHTHTHTHTTPSQVAAIFISFAVLCSQEVSLT